MIRSFSLWSANEAHIQAHLLLSESLTRINNTALTTSRWAQMIPSPP
jgi:hypothetical protein